MRSHEGRPRFLLLALATVVALSGLLGAAPDPVSAAALAKCNPVDPPPSPGGLNVPYKSLPEGDLLLDVYIPEGDGPFPAIVLVHGGGYRSGCKGGNAEEAKFIADHGYVAFNINYRLACDPAAPPPDVQDPAVECSGDGVGARSYLDIQDAIRFVRDHGAEYRADSARVALLGLSSGATNTLMAAATGNPGDNAPDVVASWSGSSELGFLTDGVTPACTVCTDPKCMEKREQYVGCPLRGPDGCPGMWYALSAYTMYPPSGPPVFIANGTREPVGFVEAFDLRSRLVELGVPRQLCKVKGSFHAAGMADRHCVGDPVLTVFERTLVFVADHLPTA